MPAADFEDVDGAVVVEVVESGGEGCQVGLMDGVGDGHGDLLLAGKFQREPDVLLGDDHRGWRVLPLLGEEMVDEAHVGSGGAEAEFLDQIGNVESGLRSKDQGFLDDHVSGEDDHVVDQLVEAAHAGIAEMEDIRADVIEEGADALEGLAVAAAVDGQRALTGPSRRRR